MSLRRRLALVLAGVMVGPLIAACLIIGVFAPRAVEDVADQQADQATDAVAQELSQMCLGVGDAVSSLTNQLLGAAASTRTVKASDARHRVAEAATRRPGLQVVVLGPGGDVLAAAGPLDSSEAGSSARIQEKSGSCSQRRMSADAPALAETLPVELAPAGSETTSGDGATTLARVVVWYPVDDALLETLANAVGLSTTTDLLALRPAGPGGQPRVLASTLPEGRITAVLDSLDGLSGTAVGRRFVVRSEPRGVPFDVVGMTRPRDLRNVQAGLFGLVALAAVGAVVGVSVLAGRLTAPLQHVADVADRLRAGDLTARTGLSGRDEVGRLALSFDAMADELSQTVQALRDRSHAVSEMFDRLGEVLGRSHDLNGLVTAVLDAALLGSDAAVGVVLLGDVGGLQVRACKSAEGRPEPTPEFSDGLGSLAQGAVERRDVVRSGVDGSPMPPDGLLSALALPMMKGDRVFGALALARADGQGAFDPDTTGALRVLAGQAGTAIANVRQHEETRRQSVTDPLTGAGNFRHLSSTLAREVERAVRFGHPLAVLMLDLDHFKQVNDSLGHGFGDAVLREFARRLQQCLREVDTVARYGGEEFCVIAPETDIEGACRVADRIVGAVRGEPFTVGDRSRKVTVSVGVAAHPEHGATASEIMGAADAALYAAKRTGRDRWVLAGPTGGRPKSEQITG